MIPLSTNDIESELSYAYLHAVAAKAGMSCSIAGRHEDNRGVDALLKAYGPFTKGAYLTSVQIDVQLKATFQDHAETPSHRSYPLDGINRYNQLRNARTAVPLILVVLFLPRESADWLSCTPESLALKRCAYWVSLRNASDSNNSSSVTVSLPKANLLTPENLWALADRLSLRDIPSYLPP